LPLVPKDIGWLVVIAAVIVVTVILLVIAGLERLLGTGRRLLFAIQWSIINWRIAVVSAALFFTLFGAYWLSNDSRVLGFSIAFVAMAVTLSKSRWRPVPSFWMLRAAKPRFIPVSLSVCGASLTEAYKDPPPGRRKLGEIEFNVEAR
jgi:hypothetical protein